MRVEQANIPTSVVALALTVHGRVKELAPGVKACAPGELVYQWPGIGFEAAFHGRTVYFNTGQGRQALHVSVDGDLVAKLLSTAPTMYRASGLTDGDYHVHVQVVDGRHSAPEDFRGFLAPAGGVEVGPGAEAKAV